MSELAAQKFCKSVCYLRGKYTNSCTNYQPKTKKFFHHFYELFFQNLDHLLTKKLSVSPDKLTDRTLEFWDYHSTSVDCKCSEQFQNQSMSLFFIQTKLFVLFTLCRSHCDLCSVPRIIRGILSSGGKCKKKVWHSTVAHFPFFALEFKN
jgi:hypothetical protein